MVVVYETVETIVEKRRKCWSLAFSPLFTMFSKGFSFKVVTIWDCVGKSSKYFSSDKRNVNQTTEYVGEKKKKP